MKYFALFPILSMVFSSSFAQDTLNACERQGQSYSKFWGQEYTGSDLIRSELKIDQSHFELSTPSLAIFDTGFEREHIPLTREIDVPPYLNGRRRMTAHHGTMVANLIGGPYPYGASENYDLIYLGAVAVPMYAYHIRQFEKQGQFPKVISNSVGWSKSDTAKLTELTDSNGTLWFLAAGNDHPNPVAPNELNSKALLIGALAPNGLQSLTSQTNDLVLTLSPGNEELASINGKGEDSLFGGTSGATPLVAANALSVAAFLPNISSEDYRTLIKNTSWPSVENLLGNPLAPGILNGYRAYRVARNIFNSCGSEDNHCHRELLHSSNTYLLEQGAVISCEEFKRSTCSEQTKLLTKMRREALLGNKHQALELSCAYQALGLTDNAKFFRLIGSSTVNLDQMKEEALKDIHKGTYESSYYRYQKYYLEVFRDALQQSDRFDDYQKREILNYSKQWPQRS